MHIFEIKQTLLHAEGEMGLCGFRNCASLAPEKCSSNWMEETIKRKGWTLNHKY